MKNKLNIVMLSAITFSLAVILIGCVSNDATAYNAVKDLPQVQKILLEHHGSITWFLRANIISGAQISQICQGISPDKKYYVANFVGRDQAVYYTIYFDMNTTQLVCG